MKNDFDHLIATKQYWVAAWRVIDASPLGDRKPLEKVDEIVRQAIRHRCLDEVRKILRDFSDYVGHDASVDAHTLLNETTDIDLQPDDLEFAYGYVPRPVMKVKL